MLWKLNCLIRLRELVKDTEREREIKRKDLHSLSKHTNALCADSLSQSYLLLDFGRRCDGMNDCTVVQSCLFLSRISTKVRTNKAFF